MGERDCNIPITYTRDTIQVFLSYLTQANAFLPRVPSSDLDYHISYLSNHVLW